MLRMNVSGATVTPLRSVLPTMQRADARLKRLIRSLAVAFIVMSVLATSLGCTPQAHLINEALDQGTLLLLALLPVLYVSGLRQ